MTLPASHPVELEARLRALRREHISHLAVAYTKFLNALDWQDRLLVGGLREARTKALSGIYMELMRPAPKYHQTHYITEGALALLATARTKADGLRYEHIVPCAEYVRDPCEEAARTGALTNELVVSVLDRYWWLATILKSEDMKLPRFSMPSDWDGNDVLARYRKAGIVLMPNPLFGNATHKASWRGAVLPNANPTEKKARP